MANEGASGADTQNAISNSHGKSGIVADEPNSSSSSGRGTTNSTHQPDLRDHGSTSSGKELHASQAEGKSGSGGASRQIDIVQMSSSSQFEKAVKDQLQKPSESTKLIQATIYGAQIQQIDGQQLTKILAKYGQVFKIVFTYKQMVFSAEMALRGYTKIELYKEFAYGTYGKGWRFYDTIDICQQVQISDKTFCEVMTMDYYNQDAVKVPAPVSTPQLPDQTVGKRHALSMMMYQKVCEGIGSNQVIGPNHQVPFVFSEMTTSQMMPGHNLNALVLGNMKELLDPDKLLSFLTFDNDTFLKFTTGMLNENFLALTLQNIRVREIWISGHTPESDIGGIDFKEICAGYGEIEGIDANNKPGKSFAFVRFKKVSAAVKAFESIDEIARMIRRRIKISFSDFTKRPYIVGDSPLLTDNTDSLSQFMFAGFPVGVKLPLASKIRSLLTEFLPIKNLVLKEPLSCAFRAFFLVEYESKEQAIAARKHFYLDDINGNRRKLFGSAEMELNIVVVSTPVRKFEISGQMQSIDLTPSKIAYKEKNGVERVPVADVLKIFSPKVPKPKENIAELAKKLADQTFLEVPTLIEKDLVWSGMVYKGAAHHFVADVYHLTGDRSLSDKYLENRLIINELQEIPQNIMSLPVQSTLVIVPSNTLQKKVALEFVSEFNTSGICGVVLLNNKSQPKVKLIMLASCPTVRGVYPEVGEVAFLGLICVASNSSSQMLNEHLTKRITDCTQDIVSDNKEKLIPHHEEESMIMEEEIQISPERGDDFHTELLDDEAMLIDDSAPPVVQQKPPKSS